MTTSTKNPLHVPSPFQASAPEMTPEQKEQEYVHNVYQVIAPHFSATRYKPWPVVEEFLTTMPAGFVGADVGCGNGKYIGVNPKLFMVGSDRSSNLISICGERGHEAMVCDGLSLPYRSEFFDFAISIAVIHHFISPERRIAAIEEILRVVRLKGRVLIFVWALEQQGKRDFDKETQDVFVPWAMPKKAEPKKEKIPKANSRPQGVKKKDRKKAATATAVEAAAETVAPSLGQLSFEGNEEEEGEKKKDQDSTVEQPEITSTETATSAIKSTEDESKSSDEPAALREAPVYNRYYHLFHKGELEDLVVKTNKASIIQTGYDRDNWWCILEKTSN
ncbi:tRNA methyltransferase, has a role in tRNA modification [Gryganskiella cystojenkinii]|nr:tRNA methyltransferase, has a role in tRNA modification [Gryganskiella cystojenkinii]